MEEVKRIHGTKMRKTMLLLGDADMDNWPVLVA